MYGAGARNGFAPGLLPGAGARNGFTGILLNVRRDELSGIGEARRLTGFELSAGFFGIAEFGEPAPGEIAAGPSTFPPAL